MNYDLALMALDGLTRAPLRIQAKGSEVLIEGSPAAFKELARLCLLIGGGEATGEAFELQPGLSMCSVAPSAPSTLSWPVFGAFVAGGRFVGVTTHGG